MMKIIFVIINLKMILFNVISENLFILKLFLDVYYCSIIINYYLISKINLSFIK